MESLLCYDLELHNQEILGIGGLSDCGMVFSLANKNARECEGQIYLFKEAIR